MYEFRSIKLEAIVYLRRVDAMAKFTIDTKADLLIWLDDLDVHEGEIYIGKFVINAERTYTMNCKDSTLQPGPLRE